MVTSGRGNSPIRTPQIVRRYLSGETLASERRRGAVVPAVDPLVGDWIGHMHSQVKTYILSERLNYQYPRRHSFQALIGNLLALGLIERTGQEAEPVSRGAGQGGTASGFNERVWVRIVPALREDPAWLDPIAARGRQLHPETGYHRPRPEVGRPRRQEVRVERIRPAQPGRAALPRRTRRIVENEPSAERLQAEAVTGLMERRQRLAAAAAQVGTRGGMAQFVELSRRAQRLRSDLARVYPVRGNTYFTGLDEMIRLLNACIAPLEAEPLMARRGGLLVACQSHARLLGEALLAQLPRLRAEQAQAEQIVCPFCGEIRSGPLAVSSMRGHIAQWHPTRPMPSQYLLEEDEEPEPEEPDEEEE